MAGRKLLSEVDKNKFYESELLGGLIGLKFWPEFGPFGWGQFSREYRAKLNTYALAKSLVVSEQKYVSTRPAIPPRSLAEQARIKPEVAAQSAYFAQIGKRLDLSKLDFLKPAD